jgi:hypothetical protein
MRSPAPAHVIDLTCPKKGGKDPVLEPTRTLWQTSDTGRILAESATHPNLLADSCRTFRSSGVRADAPETDLGAPSASSFTYLLRVCNLCLPTRCRCSTALALCSAWGAASPTVCMPVEQSLPPSRPMLLALLARRLPRARRSRPARRCPLARERRFLLARPSAQARSHLPLLPLL